MIVATSGGDWGTPYGFDDGADTTAGSEVEHEPPTTQAPDPVQWEYDSASGTYYRATTSNERSANKWPESAILIIPDSTFVSGATGGSATVDVSLPLAEYPGYAQVALEFISLDLEMIATHHLPAHAQMVIKPDGTSVRTVHTPDIHFYLSTGVSWNIYGDNVVRAFASERGGIELNGLRDDRSFRLHGPYTRSQPYVLDIAPPSRKQFWMLQTGFSSPGAAALMPAGGDAPGLAQLARHDAAIADLAASVSRTENGTPAGQCLDGLDNDTDSVQDSCDFSCVEHPDFSTDDIAHTVLFEQTKNFAIIGDSRFCDAARNNYETVLSDIGHTAAQILNWVEPPPGLPRVPPVRYALGGCIYFADGTAGNECHFDPSFCPVGGLYPFEGVGQEWGPSGGNVISGYIGHVWEGVDTVAEMLGGANAQPVSLAIALASEAPFMSDQVGRAYFDISSTSTLWMAGSAVVDAPGSLHEADNEGPVGVAGGRVAHELGHTMGLWHDNAPGGFMQDDGGAFQPFLDWTAPSRIPVDPEDPDPDPVMGFFNQEFAWTQFAPDKWNPRPSGFSFTPCVNDGECDNGFPGLTCVGEGWCR